MRRSHAVAAAITTLVMLGACTDEPDRGTASSSTDPNGGADASTSSGRTSSGSGSTRGTASDSAQGSGALVFRRALQAFADCDEALAWVTGEALERVQSYGLPGISSPYGYDGGGLVFSEGDVGVTATTIPAGAERVAADASAGAAIPTAAPASDGGATNGGFSGTNVQEQGVDEPDLVKTDGERIVTIVNGVLHVIDITGDEPRQLGRLALQEGYAHDLFLSGDKAIVLVNGGGYASPITIEADVARGIPYPGGFGEITVVLEIDLAEPTEPAVLRTLRVDGRYLSARMVDGVARIVVSAAPTGLVFSAPQSTGLRGVDEAIAKNRAVIESSAIDDWVPYYKVEEADGTVSAEGPLLGCDQLAHPTEFAGFRTTTVLTVDVAAGVNPDSAFGLFSDGQTIYASAESLYVTSPQWVDWDAINIQSQQGQPVEAPDFDTTIHQFDISEPRNASYVASGTVPGLLLSSYSMSEHDGHLRVATTRQPSFFCCFAPTEGDGQPDESDSVVTILRPDGDTLVETGRVVGLGRGEQIYAVRMIGEVGYVVTFRQTDPLYTLDLSDPTAPAVVGELKVPGYSAYLHPVGDGLLLGVGQEADAGGRVLGAKVSLFDVSDPASPREVDTMLLSSGQWSSSSVEYDTRAFLFWQPTGLVMLPVQAYGEYDPQTGQQDGFFGAVGLRIIDGQRLERIADISHVREGGDIYAGQIVRSLVAGEHLYTLGLSGLGRNDLTTLVEEAFLRL